MNDEDSPTKESPHAKVDNVYTKMECLRISNGDLVSAKQMFEWLLQE